MRDVVEPHRPLLAALGATLRTVRKHRRMSQAEVASGLGMSRRTYLDLEAGVGRMTVEQLVAFADLTDSDRFALLAAALFDKPSLAVRYADNKLMTVAAFAGDDLEAALGDAVSDVRPRELMGLLEDVLERLAKTVDQRRAERAQPRTMPPKTPSEDEEGDQ